MPRLFRDCVSFQRPQRSKLWICPPFGKASGPGGAFLPFAESLHAKQRLPVSLRRGKPQRSGVYRAGAGPGGCFSRAPLVPAWVAGSSRTALSGLRTRQRPHDWGEKPKGWLRQAAGPGEWRRIAVMRGLPALPAVVPARARDRNGLVPCPRQFGCRPRAGRRTASPGTADPPPAPRPCSSSCSRPGTSCGQYHGGQRRRPARSRRPRPLTGTTGHPVPAFSVSSRAMGALTGPEPAQGGLGQADQPGAANVSDLAGSPAGPVLAGEGRSELKRGGPGARPRVKSGQAPPGAANRPDISPVTPRNAAPNQTPGMIEGHQGLISPILTRDHETGADYGSICSIYPARFAGSGTAVALLTRNHGPAATGTFTRAGTEPKLTRSWRARLRRQ